MRPTLFSPQNVRNSAINRDSNTVTELDQLNLIKPAKSSTRPATGKLFTGAGGRSIRKIVTSPEGRNTCNASLNCIPVAQDESLINVKKVHLHRYGGGKKNGTTLNKTINLQLNLNADAKIGKTFFSTTNASRNESKAVKRPQNTATSNSSLRC